MIWVYYLCEIYVDSQGPTFTVSHRQEASVNRQRGHMAPLPVMGQEGSDALCVVWRV